VSEGCIHISLIKIDITGMIGMRMGNNYNKRFFCDKTDDGIELFNFGSGINKHGLLSSFNQVHGGFVISFNHPHVVFEPGDGDFAVLKDLACGFETKSQTG
jgi:hypothetical protein